MISRFDAWIGKHLFVPPIVRWCQFTGMTQHAVASYCSWISGLVWLWCVDISDSWFLWFLYGIMVLAVIFNTIRAGMTPDTPSRPMPWLRKFIEVWLVIDLSLGVAVLVVDGHAGALLHWTTPFWLLILIGEWASTITTIPPKEVKEAKPAHRLAKADA